MGHEERLPPSRLSGCSRFGQQTFAVTQAKGETHRFCPFPASGSEITSSLIVRISNLWWLKSTTV
jgi:hypothetical protein